jgi:hypothetical protein
MVAHYNLKSALLSSGERELSWAMADQTGNSTSSSSNSFAMTGRHASATRLAPTIARQLLFSASDIEALNAAAISDRARQMNAVERAEEQYWVAGGRWALPGPFVVFVHATCLKWWSYFTQLTVSWAACGRAALEHIGGACQDSS